MYFVPFSDQISDLCSRQYDNTSTMFMISTPSGYRSSTTEPTIETYSSELSKTRRLETERRYADERRQAILKDVVEMEVKLAITTRWQPSSSEYINAVQYLGRRKYEKALDHLQKLVVQRLFKLHRMNQSRNGMSQCLSLILSGLSTSIK
jgi:hypothetical protein